MAVRYHIAVSGSTELQAAMRDVSPRFQIRVLKGAMNRAGTLFTRELRRRTPKGQTGKLRKAIAKKVVHFKKTGAVVLVVGFRSRAAPHAHIVEGGTKERWTEKDVRAYRGIMPAFRMLERTIQAKAVEYRSRIASEVRSGLEKVVKQAARGSKTIKAKVPRFLR